MSLKLKDFLLKKNPEGKKVCIGTGDGSSYVYIGEVDFDKIEKSFEAYKDQANKNRESAKNILQTLTMEVPGLTDDKKKRSGKGNKTDKVVTDPFDIHLKYALKLSKTLQKYRIADRYLKSYKSPLNRMIIEHYDRFSDDKIAIIITGVEIGDLWDEEDKLKKVTTKRFNMVK